MTTLGQGPGPAAPTGLAIVASDGQLSLDWADNAEPEVTGYNVYRSATSGGPYTQIATVIASDYVDAPLANGTTQHYVVTALDTAPSESRFSSEAAGTPADVTTPSAPTGLGTLAGDAQASLDWTDNPKPNVTGYHVLRSTVSSGPYTQIATVAGSDYVDSPLVNGTTYFYVVTAIDGAAMRIYKDGFEAASRPKTGNLTTNPAVGAWIGADPTNNKWFDGVIDSTGPAVNFETFALSPPFSTSDLESVTLTSTGGSPAGDGAFSVDNFLWTGPGGSTNPLTPGTTYDFTVSAFDAAANESAPSAPLQVITPN